MLTEQGMRRACHNDLPPSLMVPVLLDAKLNDADNASSDRHNLEK
jgi:hypothetical protein